ncbi:hypothetical protein [Gimibacter soli]|uniref:SPOR domain-containing protein n=1 Tax=Gimibacter soli TaxID=3024400 RepID=A0AAF0BHD8_9PROT|nr:hypothetical protein [Gimibacter soli]WCL54208.1 hypothetical protein PH603_00355 [Gimibacter soli]
MRGRFTISVVALLVSAGLGIGGAAGAAPKAIPKAIAKPFCEGDYEAAAAALSASGNTDIASRFYAAYIAELLGHGGRIRPLYMALASSDDRTPVALSCSGKSILPVNEAASGRLTVIAFALRSMDAAVGVPFKLHRGLPETKPVRVPSAPATAATPTPAKSSSPKPVAPKPDRPAPSPSIEVTAPASHDPNGRWFAHLVSFFEAAEAAESVKGEIRRYPALAGMFDTMQVTAKGRDTWRVGVRTSDWSDADRLCVAVRASGDYCRVIDTAN